MNTTRKTKIHQLASKAAHSATIGVQHLPVSSEAKSSKWTSCLALTGIILVAFNLRIAAVAPSPIYHQIAKSFPIGANWQGIMGTLPLLSFGIFGMLTPRLNRKVGLERGMIIAMLLIVTGEVFRACLSGSIIAFALFSLISLAGMGMGNVLILPAIKHYFPKHIGGVTGLYLVLIAVSASVPSSLAVPVTHSMGWRFSIGIWSLVAALAALPWFGLVQPHVTTSTRQKKPAYQVWRWPVTWAIVILFSVGAMVMYALIAWLPTILTATAAKSAATAGIMLAIYNISGLPHSLLIPLIQTRIKYPFLIVLSGGFCTVLGSIGLAYLPGHSWFWIFPLGLGAMLVPVGLTFVNMRTKTEEGTTALSGFVQGAGYLIASIGPFLVGYFHTFSGSWVTSLWFMAIAGVVAVFAGIIAVRNTFLEDMKSNN